MESLSSSYFLDIHGANQSSVLMNGQGHLFLSSVAGGNTMNVSFSPAVDCLGRFGARGVLPYMGYMGMCGPKGYGFSAVLVINWVSILAILPPFW